MREHIDWKAIHHGILQRLNIRAEVESLGVRFAATKPSGSGWLTCHAIGRDDANPSAAVNVCGQNGELGRYRDLGGDGTSCSFWDLGVKAGRFTNWQAARAHYATVAGVELPNTKGSSNGGRAKPRLDLTRGLRFLDDAGELLLQWADTKPPITRKAIEAAGGRACQFRDMDCIGFPATRDFREMSAVILYRVDGTEFPATKKSGPRKTHLMYCSKDGWLVFGRDSDGNAVRQADAVKSCGVVWAVEGVGDALALWRNLQPGEAVVTNFRGPDLWRNSW